MTTPELQLIWPEWEIVRPLGEGAFGKVYEIRREGDGFEERAALKVIHIPQSDSEVKYLRSEGADDDSVSAHFRELAGQLSNEIATQAKLKGNSNIVSYEDRKVVPDTNGVGYTILIRMELLTSLLDHMAVRPMERDDVLQLGLDMARALLLCERHKIVHRDIKPQNIFISPNRDYKLGDFGVARELEKTTANLSRKGTYNYMAPEVFHGRPGNATVDIYSLGVVLYTLLNGNRAPFLDPPPAPFPSAREREAAQHRRLSGEALPPIEGVPAALNELVLRMCAFEPRERPQNARALAEAMESVAYELRAEKTVGLFSWIGGNTPSVAPPGGVLTEDEGSRWLDGTPVMKEKAAVAPKPAPEPELVAQAPQKHTGVWIQILIAVLVIGTIVALVALLGRDRLISPTLAPTTTRDLSLETTISPEEKLNLMSGYENALEGINIYPTTTKAVTEQPTTISTTQAPGTIKKQESTSKNSDLIYVTNKPYRYTTAPGGSYTGYWKDGKPEGYGTHTNDLGNKYVGYWKDGRNHGEGIQTFAGGNEYVGEFKNGGYYKGTMTYKDGTKYVGEWAGFSYNGQGVLYDANGNILQQGTWSKGEFIG